MDTIIINFLTPDGETLKVKMRRNNNFWRAFNAVSDNLSLNIDNIQFISSTGKILNPMMTPSSLGVYNNFSILMKLKKPQLEVGMLIQALRMI
jgi:hypothetical protein